MTRGSRHNDPSVDADLTESARAAARGASGRPTGTGSSVPHIFSLARGSRCLAHSYTHTHTNKEGRAARALRIYRDTRDFDIVMAADPA